MISIESEGRSPIQGLSPRAHNWTASREMPLASAFLELVVNGQRKAG